MKLQLNLEELSENFGNNYHINKLENSIDQVDIIFFCNHEVFRVRFRLVSCLSLLSIENRRDDNEEREDRNLSPI